MIYGSETWSVKRDKFVKMNNRKDRIGNDSIWQVEVLRNIQAKTSMVQARQKKKNESVREIQVKKLRRNVEQTEDG